MISIAFVGLCLTSFPNVLGLSYRSLRTDFPLASYFPAWIDSAYDPVGLPVDEPETLKPDVAELAAIAIDDSVELATGASVVDGSRVSAGRGLPSVLTDLEMDDLQGWDSMAASRTMDDVLVYHTGVDNLYDISEDPITSGVSVGTDVSDASRDVPDIFSFAGFSTPEEELEVDDPEIQLDVPTFSATVFRAEALEFCLSARLVEVGPEPVPEAATLRIEAPVFIPRAKVVAPTPLRKDAPEFKVRSALALAFEARGSSDLSSTRDAKDLACAARMGLVTPKKIMRLEAPRLNKDAPVFLPRAMVLQTA